MEYVYICSRYRSDDEYSADFNIATAELACRTVVKTSGKTVVPIAPHLYFPRFMNDGSEEERRLALKIGLEELRKCKRMKVIVIDGIISEGMLEEIYEAQKREIPIDYYFCAKEEMEEFIESMLDMSI